MELLEILVVLIGVCIGSFLNVCIYRIPKKESIVKPPSHCTNCGYKLRALDLIPVISYMFLRGKCKKCKSKISIKYPAIELLTGVIFYILFYKYSFSVEFFIYVVFMSVLIAVFFIDLEHLIIPNRLVIAALIVAIIASIYNVFNPMSIYGSKSVWSPVLGVFIGSGSLLLVSLLGVLVYKENEVMGMGDVKIFGPIGMILGWKMTIITLMLSAFSGAIIGVLLIILGIKDKKSTVAFGPFIVLSTFATLMWGWQIFNWWISLY